MKKLIGFLAGLISLLGGFHIYLNLTQEKSISFEQTLKILKDNIENQPIRTAIIILIILLVSLIVVFAVNKIFEYIAYRERKR